MNKEISKDFKGVYLAIAGVISDLCKQGVSKSQTNTFDRYNFRGIDDVYNALAPLLAKHNLVVLPRVLDRQVLERTSDKGKAVFYVTVTVEYDFVCALDGSSHTIASVGEAMDRGDKATNKAMSAAYKYACFQAFCIPTEAQDADAETHEVMADPQPQPAKSYDNKEFDRLYQQWVPLVQSGAKTPEQIINSIRNKGVELSNAQRNAIINIRPEEVAA